MKANDARTRLWNAVLLLAGAALAACGNGSSGGGSTTTSPQCDETSEFASTFAGIQEVVFERHGCTQAVCHGAATQGGLDLRPEVAYANLFEAPSVGSRFPRVVPGDNDRSFLWLKLAAATNPGSVEITGAPMPNGLAPLSADELEAVRLWIYAGAPQEGTVGGTETLLDACLPVPEPIIISPLEPPPASEGFQFVMPEWDLEKKSEHEFCFATYYDVTDKVPAEFRDPSGNYFRFSAFELRQDPQSHHLILYFPTGNLEPGGIDVHDPSFGQWTCAGGERAGQTCEPTDLSSCGAGTCVSEASNSFACIGYGPGRGPSLPIGGAQQSQAFNQFFPGVFAQVPMKGVLYWNSHAFNLTEVDTVMHARLNYIFADEQQYPVTSIFNASRIFAANAAPYTTQTVCNDHVVPRGARLFELTSHTHQRGKHFTVDTPDGTRIYESFVYNDPVRQRYDPPLAFDSPDPAQRTLRYCSLYNNGVAADGSPDPVAVTRASRVPSSATATLGRCRPVACAAGAIGAPCDGADDDATCDTSPGAGDGLCDACNITGGESTENEMFILFGSLYVDPVAAAGGASSSAGGAALAAAGAARSDFSGLALPGHYGCSSSKSASTDHSGHTAGAHAAHAGHAGH